MGRIKNAWRKLYLAKSDYAKNGCLYLVTRAGAVEEWGADPDSLEEWFTDGDNHRPHLFRNGSLNDFDGAVGGAVALCAARNLASVLLVYAPIGMGDYMSNYRELNPPVDRMVKEFARLARAHGKKGRLWTHSFAGPSTTIALSNLLADPGRRGAGFAPTIQHLKHESVAPAFFHANEYKAGLMNTKVKTVIYQASGDTVSRSGSYTQNPFSYSVGAAHDAVVRARPNIEFIALTGGGHPLATYLEFDELRKRLTALPFAGADF